jgi:hypothetical protein
MRDDVQDCVGGEGVSDDYAVVREYVRPIGNMDRCPSQNEALAALARIQQQAQEAVEGLRLCSHDERLQCSGQDDYLLVKIRAIVARLDAQGGGQ